MLKDGICHAQGETYNKMIAFEDINYQLANEEDQNTIFEKYCEFLNYFDAAISVQLVFINKYGNPIDYETSIRITGRNDGYDDIRAEYENMLKTQLTKGNNGIIKQKYVVFGIELSKSSKFSEAKTRLERIQNDILNNFKKLGVIAYPLTGEERLEVLHGQLHPNGREKFHMYWDAVTKEGMSTKDFIAPSSFDFGSYKSLRMGDSYAAASFLSITAPSLTDQVLADYLNLDMPVMISIHINAIDQQEAIKTVKRKLTSINAEKIDAQKKANRDGYDMDIMSPDLATNAKETEEFLNELQSSNERMFNLLFTVLNIAPNKQALDDIVFTSSGIAQKRNCALKRLDYQ